MLARHGFLEAHRRGSHIIMQKKLSVTTITAPVPNHNERRLGTLQSIIPLVRHLRSEFES
ncbi:MAG: type II toxin-antitoxin system HicA family toxin [Nitrosomonas sp.]|nr:type II toxin-antitoxin system HicA family toxin [Nitrosomonas sp.]